MGDTLKELWTNHRTIILIVIFGVVFIVVTQWVMTPAPHPLVGKPAPSLDLGLLEGGAIDLAAHRGKDVVVLDFWASWCPPCRKSLPIMAGLSKAYAGRGAVVYGINLGEDAAVVQDFVQRQGIALPIALDPNRAAAQSYQVTSIPQSVIIGKDGIIQEVHVGLAMGFERTLRQQIDAALAAPAQTDASSVP